MVATSSQRISISVGAPARTIESVFGVGLRDYADASGRTFHAPTGEARYLELARRLEQR